MANDRAIIPTPYVAFFHWIEPFSTALGALYSTDLLPLQSTYLSLTHPPTSSVPTTIRENIVLNQLANLYFCFALLEATILRATTDLKVWRVFLFGLLVADFGHLYSVHALGAEKYWSLTGWNAIDWGNLGFVYLGATMRICFLVGVGLRTGGGKGKGTKR